MTPPETPRTAQPCCAACGQPLASWMQKHTVLDCIKWKEMRESERQEIERIVRAG